MTGQLPPGTPITAGIVVSVIGLILAVVGVQAWFDRRYSTRKEYEDLKKDFDAYVDQQVRDDARREKEDKLFDRLIEAVQNAIRRKR